MVRRRIQLEYPARPRGRTGFRLRQGEGLGETRNWNELTRVTSVDIQSYTEHPQGAENIEGICYLVDMHVLPSEHPQSGDGQ